MTTVSENLRWSFFRSLAATLPSFKRTLKKVGLPDKFHVRQANHLRIAIKIYGISLNATDLGAY
jgi:hypothetical protein